MTHVPLSQPATLALSASAAKPPFFRWLLTGWMLQTSVQTTPAICSLSGSVVLSPALHSSAASSLLLSLVCFFFLWFFVLCWQRCQTELVRIVLTNPQRDSCHCVPSSVMATFLQFTPNTSTTGASHLLIGTFVPCLYFSVALQLRFLRPSAAFVLSHHSWSL